MRPLIIFIGALAMCISSAANFGSHENEDGCYITNVYHISTTSSISCSSIASESTSLNMPDSLASARKEDKVEGSDNKESDGKDPSTEVGVHRSYGNKKRFEIDISAAPIEDAVKDGMDAISDSLGEAAEDVRGPLSDIISVDTDALDDGDDRSFIDSDVPSSPDSSAGIRTGNNNSGNSTGGNIPPFRPEADATNTAVAADATDTPSDGDSNTTAGIIMVVIILIIVLAVISCAGCCWWRYCRQPRKKAVEAAAGGASSSYDTTAVSLAQLEPTTVAPTVAPAAPVANAAAAVPAPVTYAPPPPTATMPYTFPIFAPSAPLYPLTQQQPSYPYPPPPYYPSSAPSRYW